MNKQTNPVTEGHLDEKLLALREDLREEIAINTEHLDEKNRGYRDQVLTGLDKVMKELETMREENSIGNYQIREKVEDHEKRITSLETSTQT